MSAAVDVDAGIDAALVALHEAGGQRPLAQTPPTVSEGAAGFRRRERELMRGVLSAAIAAALPAGTVADDELADTLNEAWAVMRRELIGGRGHLNDAVLDAAGVVRTVAALLATDGDVEEG